jgi:hypothetical protein
MKKTAFYSSSDEDETSETCNDNSTSKKTVSVYDIMYKSNIPISSTNVQQMLDHHTIDKNELRNTTEKVPKRKYMNASALYKDSDTESDDENDKVSEAKDDFQPAKILKSDSISLSRQSSSTMTIGDLLCSDHLPISHSIKSSSMVHNTNLSKSNNETDDWMDDFEQNSELNPSVETQMRGSTKNKSKSEHRRINSSALPSNHTKSIKQAIDDIDSTEESFRPSFSYEPPCVGVPTQLHPMIHPNDNNNNNDNDRSKISANENTQTTEPPMAVHTTDTNSDKKHGNIGEYGIGIVPSVATRYLKDYQLEGVRWMWEKYHTGVGAILG